MASVDPDRKLELRLVAADPLRDELSSLRGRLCPVCLEHLQVILGAFQERPPGRWPAAALDARVWLETTDVVVELSGPAPLPKRCQAAACSDLQRGLQLLERLADRWELRSLDPLKVRFRLERGRVDGARAAILQKSYLLSKLKRGRDHGARAGIVRKESGRGA